MNEGILYCVKLVNNEYTLGEFSEGNLVNCIHLDIFSDEENKLHYEMSPMKAYLSDADLIVIEDIKNKSIFVKELTALNFLNKSYYEFREKRLEALSKKNNGLVLS
jgi:hypothetical protein